MKKYILLILMLGCFIHVEAQKKSKRDHIKSLKIAYLTENLHLTTEEAQKFWPIYNEYEEKLFQLKYVQYKGIIKHQLSNENLSSLSEAKAKSLIREIETIDENLLKNDKELVKKLDGIISAKKIIHLKKLEHDFNRELLRRLRKASHDKKD
ncbi:hypothetical protein [Galbibacter sp. EGI 63066]|uniref:hypothetical protein n=1 Tax=Galbibacter sp. EGI 63066 TaxID=2993559 RepID=UPI002248C3EB|nr:hypothetical protein [Galbibacter sp. EGI 63066]